MGRGHVQERLLDPRRELVLERPPQLAALDAGLDHAAHIVGKGIPPQLRAQQRVDIVQQQGRNVLRLLLRGIEIGDDRRVDLELDQRPHQVAHQAVRRQRAVAEMLDALAVPLAEEGDRALLQTELLEQLVLDRVIVERGAAGFHQLAIHRGRVADGIAHHEHVAHVVEQALRRLRPAREAFGNWWNEVASSLDSRTVLQFFAAAASMIPARYVSTRSCRPAKLSAIRSACCTSLNCPSAGPRG